MFSLRNKKNNNAFKLKKVTSLEAQVCDSTLRYFIVGPEPVI